MPQDSPSVLIIRLDGIGDALALTPLLVALRDRAIPVDAVLCSRNAGIFSANALHRVVVAPFDLRTSTAGNLRRIDDCAGALRPASYTHALVATEDPSGYRLAARIGTPYRAGFANGWRKPLKTLWIRTRLTDVLYRSAALDAHGEHECETLFRLGHELVDGAPTRDVARLRPFVVDDAPVRDERVAVQITRKWERFGIGAAALASLVRTLGSRAPLRCIAPAGEDDFTAAVEHSGGIPVERFNDLGPWKNAIAAARALVAPDSGAAHVAGMTGTPAVVLFFPERRVDRQIARWHPWACDYRAITIADGWPERTSAALDALLAGTA